MMSSFDKGKGKGKNGGMGHKLTRTRITAAKFQGTVITWKGKYGWIQPAEEIQHEKATMHRGNIFVSMDDVMGTAHLDEGAPVEYHIFEDDNGLGAEELVQLGAGTGPSKGGDVKGGDFKGGKGGWGSEQGWQPQMPQQQQWGKGGAWSKDGGMDKMGFGQKGGFWDAKGKGKGFDDFKGKGKGGKGPNWKPGHLLDKSRITAAKFQGTVLEWKGKYGWLQPAEEIQHEKATRHNGRIFCSMNDIEGTELTPGAAVEFHISEDISGLAAQEVVQF